MSYADGDGARIYYEIEGNGAPLLLQHGFTQRLNDWHHAGYVKELASRYQLILVDARGHGQSDKPRKPEDYTLDKHVADVLSVLTYLVSSGQSLRPPLPRSQLLNWRLVSGS